MVVQLPRRRPRSFRRDGDEQGVPTAKPTRSIAVRGKIIRVIEGLEVIVMVVFNLLWYRTVRDRDFGFRGS